MDKSIIVIDTPSRCVDCVSFIHCSLTYGILYAKELKANNKPIKEICILKPMPEKSCHNPFCSDVGNVKVNNAFIDGFNACIDKILGDTE